MEVGAFCKTKRAGYRGTIPMYVTAEDDDGTWGFMPGGSSGRFTDEAGANEHTSAWDGGPGFVRLIPRQGWWIASWWPDGNVFIDTTTPVTRAGLLWTWIDLDLDVRQDPSGSVFVEDEDEFEAACASGLITPEEAFQARSAADMLVRRLEDSDRLFRETGWRHFDDAVTLGLPPLDAP